MRTISYTAKERRAANQVWNAAERYNFDPLFLAVETGDLDSDLYMNLIIGLAYKYYGEKAISTLFGYWNGDISQAMLDDLTWLYLEHVLYTEEALKRPSMTDLRVYYGKAFFAGEYKLSRQEWMSKNRLVYNMQSARWSSVSGKKKVLLTPNEQKLYAELTPQRMPETDRLIDTVLAIYRKFNLFDGVKHEKKALRLHFTGAFARIMTRIMPVSSVRNNHVMVMRSSEADNMTGGAAYSKKKDNITYKKENDDCSYIENCFGRSVISEQTLTKIEKELCTGSHTGCHLWFTDGKYITKKNIPKEFLHLREQSQLQVERNHSYYNKNVRLYDSLIAHIVEQIRNSEYISQKTDVISGQSGRLDTTKVWRAEYIEDNRIFHTYEDDNQPSFTVDLLLDASASRLQYQEMLAAQGVIIAKSLVECNIPVRVTRFCSVRGYTVFHILKSFRDKKCDNIFNYYAAGWNRDGLAFRGIGKILDMNPGVADRHLVIILTDAAPNDSQRILPSQDSPFGHDYSDDISVNDAAEEVRALRAKGIHVSAVFMGNDAAANSAEKIYGKEFTRIRRIDELAKAAGRLIQKEIQSLTR